MMNEEEAKNILIQEWGERGKKVCLLCSKSKPFNGSLSSFLNHCLARGGDWGGMFLTGVHKLYPDVWEAIPEKLGLKAWLCICAILKLLKVDLS